jgi:hypothetical protein
MWIRFAPLRLAVAATLESEMEKFERGRQNSHRPARGPPPWVGAWQAMCTGPCKQPRSLDAEQHAARSVPAVGLAGIPESWTVKAHFEGHRAPKCLEVFAHCPRLNNFMINFKRDTKSGPRVSRYKYLPGVKAMVKAGRRPRNQRGPCVFASWKPLFPSEETAA